MFTEHDNWYSHRKQNKKQLWSETVWGSENTMTKGTNGRMFKLWYPHGSREINKNNILYPQNPTNANIYAIFIVGTQIYSCTFRPGPPNIFHLQDGQVCHLFGATATKADRSCRPDMSKCWILWGWSPTLHLGFNRCKRQTNYPGSYIGFVNEYAFLSGEMVMSLAFWDIWHYWFRPGAHIRPTKSQSQGLIVQVSPVTLPVQSCVAPRRLGSWLEKARGPWTPWLSQWDLLWPCDRLGKRRNKQIKMSNLDIQDEGPRWWGSNV